MVPAQRRILLSAPRLAVYLTFDLTAGVDARAALFRFTRPVTSAYFWCPPIENGRLDLRVLGL